MVKGNKYDSSVISGKDALHPEGAVAQAAFEMALYWLKKVEERLAQERGKVITPYLRFLDQSCWLIDGDLVMSESMELDGDPLPEEVVETAMMPQDMRDESAEYWFKMATEAQDWLCYPKCIRLPDDHYIGSKQSLSKPVGYERDVFDLDSFPLHQCPTMKDYVKAVYSGECIGFFDEYPDHFPVCEDIFRILKNKAYVTRIVMRMTDLERIGRPSFFRTLEHDDLLVFLCAGSPFYRIHGEEKVGVEVLPSDDIWSVPGPSIDIEYEIHVSPEDAQEIKRLGSPYNQ